VRAVLTGLVSLVVALVVELAQPSSAQPPAAQLSTRLPACPAGQVLPGPVTQIAPTGSNSGFSSNMVVDDTGRLTTAFQVTHGVNPNVSELRSHEVPAAPGDPQLIRSGSGPDYPASGGRRTLGIDAAGNETLAWREGPFDSRLEPSNVMVATRTRDGAWSAPVVVNRGPGLIDHLALAVNGAGAAVLTWVRARPSAERPSFDHDAVIAAYRPASSESWLPATTLVSHAVFSEVGIDDAGTVTVFYGTSVVADAVRAVMRVRHYKPAVGWRPARKIGTGSGRLGAYSDLAVSPNGAATAAWLPVERNSHRWVQFNRRMTPAGQWLPVVRRRRGGSVTPNGLAIGGRGSAVAAWWHYPDDVVVQTSRRDGSWRRPMWLAKNQPQAYRSRLEVRMNRRGDTLVVWQLSQDLARLWGRYRPAGGTWAPAQRLSPPDIEQIAYTTAIGPDGTAAIAWDGAHGLEARQLTVC
jgi:hypothetical protein